MGWLGRRRRFLISRLQYKLLTINLLYATCLTLLFVAIVFGPLIVTLYDDSATEQRVAQAADQLLYLHKSLWPAIGILGILFGLHSLLFSHRIAGPLVAVRRVLGELGRGNLRTRSRIRAKDYLQDESQSINEMIDGLVGRLRGVESCLHRARTAAAVLAEAHARRDHDRTAQAIEQVEARLHALRRQLARFDLPAPEAAAVDSAWSESAGIPEPSSSAGQPAPQLDDVPVGAGADRLD